MHQQAREFCEQIARETGDPAGTALDIGGRDINGSCRDLWPSMRQWTIIDKETFTVGLFDTDKMRYMLADASVWEPDQEYDLVLCTEVFEHTSEWPKIIDTACKALVTGGLFVITCAGTGRMPHSAIDGAALRPGEYYRNLSAEDLGDALYFRGFEAKPIYNPHSNDIYCRAVKV